MEKIRALNLLDEFGTPKPDDNAEGATLGIPGLFNSGSNNIINDHDKNRNQVHQRLLYLQ